VFVRRSDSTLSKSPQRGSIFFPELSSEIARERRNRSFECRSWVPFDVFEVFDRGDSMARRTVVEIAGVDLRSGAIRHLQ
jgi:hypothetical protein